MPRAAPIVVALLALQAALELLFVVPGRAPEPHGLPVGVVGPAPALPSEQFVVHRHPDAAAARTAQALRELGGGAASGDSEAGGGAAGNGLPVEDVVPVAAGDPRGVALNALFLRPSPTAPADHRVAVPA